MKRIKAWWNDKSRRNTNNWVKTISPVPVKCEECGQVKGYEVPGLGGSGIVKFGNTTGTNSHERN